MKYAIVFASKHGQTRNISEFIKRKLYEDSENSVHFFDLLLRKEQAHLAQECDVIVIGTPIYVGRFQNSVIKWIKDNKNWLKKKKLAFFTVSLNAEDQHTEARLMDDQLLKDLIQQSGIAPNYVASFSGALNYRDYGFITRWILKRISGKAGGPTDTSRNYEFTHWDQVEEFVKAISTSNVESPFLLSRRLPWETNLSLQ